VLRNLARLRPPEPGRMGRMQPGMQWQPSHRGMLSGSLPHGRPKAVIGHPIWGRGGAEVAAMWIVEALCEDFEVTVYTRGGFALDELNAIAGTSVASDRIRVSIASGANSAPIGALAHRRFLRGAREMAPMYDLCVTASGSIDWGVPAVQFLSSLAWHPALRHNYFRKTLPKSARAIRRRIGDTIFDRVFPPPFSNSPGDLYIANSEWTAAHSRPYCRGRVIVIHPAVKIDDLKGGGASPTSHRFLCFGRISPEKKIEECIRILECVRLQGFDISLDVVGEVSSKPYFEGLKSEASRSPLPVHFIEAILGQRKPALLRSYAFGINCCDIEAFGISTAEMTASGIIVFAPEISAQGEILKSGEQLFRSQDDAVAKIAAVLNDGPLQDSIRALNQESAKRFDPGIFKSSVLLQCKEFMRGKNSLNAAGSL
jgi:glycosyltransferase involved in cell wall biosynthesis